MPVAEGLVAHGWAEHTITRVLDLTHHALDADTALGARARRHAAERRRPALGEAGERLLRVGLVLSRDVRLPLPDVLGWLTVLAAAPDEARGTGIEATARAVQTDEGHYARRWFTR